MTIDELLRDMIRTIIREELRAALSSHQSNVAERPADDWLDERALAQWLGVGRSTLQQGRYNAAGPPWVKFGRRVRYRRADVVAWLEARKRGAVSNSVAKPLQRTRLGRPRKL